MIMGTGFAPFRGGPLRYADARGIGAVVSRLQELESRVGARFAPANLLVEMQRQGRSFYSDPLPRAATDAA
ncbi:MAG: hypothetical protein HC882_08180 [Acidobacteria bacterium]|nr:hypothetical protein [Acidobacteriota bacterium]